MQGEEQRLGAKEAVARVSKPVMRGGEGEDGDARTCFVLNSYKEMSLDV